MAQIPEPTPTPDGPSYEGRLLDKPREEVVDQGLRFDVATLVSRRGILTLLGAGASVFALAACTPVASSTPSATASGPAANGLAGAEIPDETDGPYPGDGSNGPDILEQTGIVRRDIRSSIDGSATATGVPMTLSMTILDMANNNVPFENVAVYVWHCDDAGGYSLYSSGLEDVSYLRGVQVADSTGTVTFDSVFPGCYSGRWPHVHFEVYPNVESITDSANAISTSQVALPKDACDAVYATTGYEASISTFAEVSLDNDLVFGDDGGELQLGTATGTAESGFAVALTVRVDTTTAPRG